MEEVYKRAAPKICTAKVSNLSPNKAGAMLKQIFILLPLQRAQNKAQRHQCSTWRGAGVSKASPCHPFPWKLEVLQVVLHSLAKTLWLWYGTRIFLLCGNTPPLSHYPRLSPICSIEVWWLCSLLPVPYIHLPCCNGQLPEAVSQEKLMAWACFPAPGTCFICLAGMQKVGSTTRQKVRLLKWCLFADIQEWFGILDSGSHSFFQAKH